MSIQRFRSLDEARDALVRSSTPDELVRRIAAVQRRAAFLAGVRPLPGVQRFRTIEGANEAREAATTARMRALRAERSAD